LPLTPLSGLQSYIVGNNIVKENSKEFSNPLVPSVVFTHPNLATNQIVPPSDGVAEIVAKPDSQMIAPIVDVIVGI
jgi:hypothetical protein